MRAAGRSTPVSIGDGSQLSKRCYFKPILAPILKTLMRRAGRRSNGSRGCGRNASAGARAERVEHGSPSRRSFETPILETLARGVGRRPNGPIKTPVLKTLMRRAGRRPNGSGGCGRRASTRAERVEHGSPSRRSFETPIIETLCRGVGRRPNGPVETPVLKTLMRRAGRRPNGSGGCGRRASTGARAERVERGGSSQRSIETPILETLARGAGSCGAPTAHYGQTGFGQAGARVGARRRTGGASRSAEEEQHRQEELERRRA